MIKKSIEKALNEQINAELYSSYLYLSMSSYFHSVNLPGFANWMRTQALEELVHADKLYNFVIERGGRVILASIDAPPKEWNAPLDAFEGVYKHEQKVTSLINNLVDLAIKENDHATNIFLQWFVTEQVEEEASADEVVQKLKLTGGQGNSLFMLDKELSQRVFTPPATKAGE
ncbi:MAG: ferritin [Deltaproteobacteria bacterium]|nr:MAG: ferritin [Deltaproteobacteria bacterium]